MLRQLRTVYFSICVLLLLPHVAAAQQQTSEPPLITVTGQADIKVAPDEAVITIAVNNTDMDMLVAKNQNDTQVKAVLALARQYKIAPQDVQTNYISVEPTYSSFISTGDDDNTAVIRPRKKPEFLGYKVSKTLVVRLADISRFESLFSDILRAGVTGITDVDFRTTQIRKYRDEARVLAITAAREKAITLTKPLGQGIGNAYTIREGSGNSYSSNISANNTTVISGNYSSDETSSFAPGLINVSAQVTVSFRLN